ncbi:hypothetical protein [Polyangium jinanense]|uniref:Peptidase S1 n=1 Tax=Polyangium jinanense TaxID=2829994 RepID=A0A9X3X997_9BACT|nr:hypothetical protein [Polyangium jinanense]MDC3959966.1 hypothetical protein [Polyangium jinanense]MDC3983846.1 hypothetical protein [Polyangium jinanense]
MKKSSLACFAGLTALLVATSAFARIDFTLNPREGETTLRAGFSGDPFLVIVTAGGSNNVSSVRSGCEGFVADAPDYRVRREGVSTLLRFYVTSGEDTTLLISDPSGQWYCSDDSYGTRNPTIDLSNAPEGRYDIWVGTRWPDRSAQAVLSVTEAESNHP